MNTMGRASFELPLSYLLGKELNGRGHSAAAPFFLRFISYPGLAVFRGISIKNEYQYG